MIKEIPPINAFEEIHKYCKITNCYECIARRFKAAEKGKIDDDHFVCSLRNLEPEDWNISELKSNYRDVIVSNLESMSNTAGLRSDKKATIEAAIDIINK